MGDYDTVCLVLVGAASRQVEKGRFEQGNAANTRIGPFSKSRKKGTQGTRASPLSSILLFFSRTRPLNGLHILFTVHSQGFHVIFNHLS